MADITQTAANVRAYAGASTQSVTAGETITAGDLVYKDTADDNEYKACDTSSAAKANASGMALTNAGDGESLIIVTRGDINPGGTVAIGEIYTVSDNAGKWAPAADNGSGDYVTVCGIGTTTSKIQIGFVTSAIAHA